MVYVPHLTELNQISKKYIKAANIQPRPSKSNLYRTWST